MTNPAHLSGPSHLESFIVTPSVRTLIGTLQKPRHRDADGNSLNRRAVIANVLHES